MNYRIEKKEAFRIVGLSAPMKSNTEENFSVVPQLWGRAAEECWIGKLAAMMNAQPMGILGVSACFEHENWKYFISVATDLPAEAPLEEYVVPAFTWAIFSGEGVLSLIHISARSCLRSNDHAPASARLSFRRVMSGSQPDQRPQRL